jgi:hypothetical protein
MVLFKYPQMKKSLSDFKEQIIEEEDYEENED